MIFAKKCNCLTLNNDIFLTKKIYAKRSTHLFSMIQRMERQLSFISYIHFLQLHFQGFLVATLIKPHPQLITNFIYGTHDVIHKFFAFFDFYHNLFLQKIKIVQ